MYLLKFNNIAKIILIKYDISLFLFGNLINLYSEFPLHEVKKI